MIVADAHAESNLMEDTITANEDNFVSMNAVEITQKYVQIQMVHWLIAPVDSRSTVALQAPYPGLCIFQEAEL